MIKVDFGKGCHHDEVDVALGEALSWEFRGQDRELSAARLEDCLTRWGLHCQRPGPDRLELLLPRPRELWPGQRSQCRALHLLREHAVHELLLQDSELEVSAGIPSRSPARVVHLPWPHPGPMAAMSDISPQVQEGLEGWLESYQSSRLCRFHRHYYEQLPYPPADWPSTYARLPSEDFPECLKALLQGQPHWLEHWDGARLFVRGLLALGWHPRHLAGILHWRWSSRDGLASHSRQEMADHLVRCLSALVLLGKDRLARFDCDAVRSLGACPPSPCCRTTLEQLRRGMGEVQHT